MNTKDSVTCLLSAHGPSMATASLVYPWIGDLDSLCVLEVLRCGINEGWIVFFEGTFVALTDSGRVAISTDGIADPYSRAVLKAIFGDLGIAHLSSTASFALPPKSIKRDQTRWCINQGYLTRRFSLIHPKRLIGVALLPVACTLFKNSADALGAICAATGIWLLLWAHVRPDKRGKELRTALRHLRYFGYDAEAATQECGQQLLSWLLATKPDNDTYGRWIRQFSEPGDWWVNGNGECAWDNELQTTLIWLHLAFTREGTFHYGSAGSGSTGGC